MRQKKKKQREAKRRAQRPTTSAWELARPRGADVARDRENSAVGLPIHRPIYLTLPPETKRHELFTFVR